MIKAHNFVSSNNTQEVRSIYIHFYSNDLKSTTFSKKSIVLVVWKTRTEIYACINREYLNFPQTIGIASVKTLNDKFNNRIKIYCPVIF